MKKVKRGWLVLVSLFPLLTWAEELLRLDFERDVTGAEPTQYDGLRPLGGNVGAGEMLPIATTDGGPIGVVLGPYGGSPVTNTVGSGNYVRYYDYDSGIAGGYEKNFVNNQGEGRDAVRFSFDFAATQSGIGADTQLRISVGQYFDTNKINMGSSANRPFLFDVRTNGEYNLSVDAEGGDLSGTYDLGTSHHVNLYVNDGQDAAQTITGPDGALKNLPTNTVTLYFDDVYIGQSPLDNTLNYLLTGSNLGRIGFFSTTADGGVDFILDNIVVEGIDESNGSGGDKDAWKTEGTVIFTEDFESTGTGEQATGERIRPNTNIGETESYPIAGGTGGALGGIIEPVAGSPVTGSVGSGHFLRTYDYAIDGGVSIERNFVSGEADQISTFRTSFRFASSSSELNTPAQLRFSIGGFSDSASSVLGASSGRPFLLYFQNSGNLLLDMADSENDAGSSFDKSTEHEVVLYINDEEDRTHTITGPDGQLHTLYSNSVSLFLDGVLIKQAPFDSELNFNLTENNFGRIGLFTLSGEAGADVIFDDFVIAEIEQPDAVFVPWPGSGEGDGVNEGPAPADTSMDYDLVYLDETFDYTNGELGAISFFTVSDGYPYLGVENNSLVFDYNHATSGELKGHYKNIFYGGNFVATDTREENAYGPGVYVRFHLNVIEAASATTGTPFLALNNPDLDGFVNGRVWIRTGETAETIQLGISPDNKLNHIVWADTEIRSTDAPLVLLKYNNETNDTRLWLNPASPDDEPDAVTFNPNDVGFYGVNALTLMMDNTEDYGTFSIDDVRVCGSFLAALDFTPVERPEILLTGSGNLYTAESPHYRLRISGNMNINSFLVGGESFLVEDGGGWEVVKSGAIGNSRQYGSAHIHIQTNWQLATASFSGSEATLNLQNNDENNEAIYRLMFDGNLIETVRGGDGESYPLPLATSIIDSEIALLTTYNALNLKGVNEARMENGNLVVDVILQPKETRVLELSVGMHQLYSPLNYQVFQRHSETLGEVKIEGRVFDDVDAVRMTFSGGNSIAGSLPYPATMPVDASGNFSDSLTLPAGGWYEAKIEYLKGGNVQSSAMVEQFGVGEVFVAAGQSNSTNSGPDSVAPESSFVVSFSGGHWQPGADPQPGNHDTSSGGSYYPALGDKLVEEYGVPVAFASTGMGASSIKFWQPDYQYNHDEYVSYARHNGLYRWTLNRIMQLGENGFRAVLWHQGESDSSHTPNVTRTSENEYFRGLKNLIFSMRRDAGWDIPWYVAKASVWPIDNPDGDDNISTAQEHIWRERIAFPGANTDTLGLEYRQPDGSRVHFTPYGLEAHAQLWFEILSRDFDAFFAVDTELLQNVRDGFGSAIKAYGDGYFETYGFEGIWIAQYPWFYGSVFGWSYLQPNSDPTESMFIYSFSNLGKGSWLYTRKDLLPYLFSYKENDWLLIMQFEEYGQAWVFRYSTGQYEMIP